VTNPEESEMTVVNWKEATEKAHPSIDGGLFNLLF